MFKPSTFEGHVQNVQGKRNALLDAVSAMKEHGTAEIKSLISQAKSFEARAASIGDQLAKLS